MSRTLCILGATGSIGRSALEVVRSHPGRFRIEMLAAARNAESLAQAAREFEVPVAALADPAAARRARELLADTPCKVVGGREELLAAIASCRAEMCLSAIVGAAGLEPTLAAVDAGMHLALANKEALVAAGSILVDRVRRRGVELLPVDSEHSALRQCLRGARPEHVRRLVITASGGPFLDWSRERLAQATPQQAMAHPTWRMGDKITVDSATLANKALEVIEAHWLFNIPYERIEVLVHPQSLVHGMVEFIDGSVMAQMAVPDMRLPIRAALAHPEMLPADDGPRLDLCAAGRLEFRPPDLEAFPLLALGLRAARAGGPAPAVFSAANEEAVAIFLEGRIGFLDIHPTVKHAMEQVLAGLDAGAAKMDIPLVLEAHRRARAAVRRRLTPC